MANISVAEAVRMYRNGEDWAGALVEAHCHKLLDASDGDAKTTALLREAARCAGLAAEMMCVGAVGVSPRGVVAHYGPVIPSPAESPIALIIAGNEGQQIGAILALDELCLHVDRARELIAKEGVQFCTPSLWSALAEATAEKQPEMVFNLLAYRLAMGRHGEEVRETIESQGAREAGLIPAVVALVGILGGKSCGVIAQSMLPAPLVASEAAHET